MNDALRNKVLDEACAVVCLYCEACNLHHRCSSGMVDGYSSNPVKDDNGVWWHYKHESRFPIADRRNCRASRVHDLKRITPPRRAHRRHYTHTEEPMSEPTINELLAAAGVQLDSHESDLYAKSTPLSLAILKQWKGQRPSRKWEAFISDLDGEEWFDIPFANDAFWKNR